MTESDVQRFWSKIDRTGDCWLWTAKTRSHEGYGLISIRSDEGQHVSWRAHRLSFVIANGPIPKGMLVCHHCDNPRCVRPDHLFLGTASDNARDAVSKGRMYRGGGRKAGVPHGVCNKGHRVEGENAQVASDKRCRQCRQDNQMQQRAKRKQAATAARTE